MGDHPHLLGIGDDDPLDMGRQQVGNRGSVAGCLDDHMVVMGEFPPGKSDQCLASHRDPAEPLEGSVTQGDGLGSNTVNVQTYDPHVLLPSWCRTGSRRATRQLRIRARSASGLVAGAAR